MRTFSAHFVALASAVAFTIGSGTATAADLRAAAPYKAVPFASPVTSWSGFYVGANAGGGSANAPSDFSVAGFPAFATAPNSLKGALGGLQAGYNWQQGAVVYGLETDFQFASINGRVEAPCPIASCGVPVAASYGHDVAWFGTARGRIGYAQDSWMIFATGGYAYARLNTTALASAGPVQAVAKWGDTMSGWSVGGGAELALSPNWSFKLEYLYADFGETSVSWALTNLPAIRDTTHLQMHVARVGVNYRF
jgi:outer membrane immunogenic protein